MSSKYNPFLHAAPDDDPDGTPDIPAGLLEAVEAAHNVSERVSKADQTYSRAAAQAARLVNIANGLMDTVAAEHDITVANSPEPGGYATRTLDAATPEQLAGLFQALNQGYDLALFAFLEAYTLINTLLSDPAIELHIGNMGTIRRFDTKESKRKTELMMQLQSPRERERARLLADGLTEIHQMVRDTPSSEMDTLPERTLAATTALYDRVNAAVKDLPNHWEDDADAR